MNTPTMEITAIHLRGYNFPDFDKLKKKGWTVPGGDAELVKDSLLKTVNEQLVMLIKSGKDISLAIRPVEIREDARGMNSTEALVLVATVFEDLED